MLNSSKDFVMQEITVQFAKDLQHVLKKHRNKIGIPFFSSFPENSCQGASVYLSLFFTWLAPESVVRVVKGSHRKLDHHHYWVELDGKVFDLTNDQFECWLGERYSDLDAPVYAKRNHPLRNYFFYKEKVLPIHAYITFCSSHANVKDVDKAQWFIIDKLKEMGWGIEQTICGNKLFKKNNSSYL